MARRRALARRRQDTLPWWHSLDAAWLALAGAGVVTLAGAGAVVAQLHAVHGLLDGAVIAPAPDARILANFRTTPSPIVDAAVVPGDGALFVARGNGTVHRLGLATGVWSEDHFDPARQFTSPIAVLQPGCGYPRPAPACAAPDALYAVTEQGGVAVREHGGWRMLAGDNAFIGRDGNTVAAAAIPAMAATDGGRFLVFGTEQQGIGVFDTRDRRWVTVPEAVQARLFGTTGTAPRVSRLLADGNGRVWVGTARGVGILAGLGQRLQGMRVEGLTGDTLDMLPDAGGGMLVLGTEPCPGPAAAQGGVCTALRRVDRGGAVTETVAGETERNDFDDTDITHVAAVAGHIRAFGRRGVYDYVEDRRRFELVCRGEVTAVWQGASGGPVVYAQNQDPSGRSAHCRRGERSRDAALTGTVITTLDPKSGDETTFRIADERIDHITLGADGRPWLLARGGSNRLFVLTGDGPRELGDAARLPASAGSLLEHASAAVEVEGRILLIGADGAALHDPVARTYRFIDRASRPEDLAAPGARLLAQDNVVWIVSAANWVSAVRVYPGTTALLDGARRWQAPEATRFTSAQVTDRGLVVTTDTGRFWLARLNHDNAVEVTPVLGPPPSRPLGPVVDALADDDGAVVADADGMFRYDARRRGWSGPVPGPRGEAIAGIAKSAADVFMLGSRGAVGYENSAVRLFGDGPPFAFARSELTDAWLSGQRLFLAAPGHVAVYDIPQRRHADQWDLAAGALTIAGVVDGQPVVWDRDGAWLGRSRLMIGDARVTSASVEGDSIVTVQRDARGAFLAEYRGRGAPPRCLFRDTENAQGAMLDARRIAAGPGPGDAALAVLSADRLRLYAPSQRRWIGVAGVAATATARLADLGSHLAVHDDGGDHAQLTLMPLSGPDALTLPPSCSAEAAGGRGAVTVAGRAIAVDEATARAAVLSADGRITRWQPDGSALAPVLEAAGTAPRPRDLHRVVDGGRTLHFAAPDGVWSYDLDLRRWRHQRFDTAGDTVRPRSLALALDGGLLAVSVRDDRDRDFAAVTAADGDADTATLREIGPGGAVTAPFDPAGLLDAAEATPGRWLFLTAGQLAAFDTATATFTTAALPAAAPAAALSLLRWGGEGGVVAVAAGDPSRPSRLMFAPAPGSGGDAAAQPFQPQRGERFAVAAGGPAAPHLVRVLADDTVQTCAIAPSGAVQPCETLMPPALTLDPAAVGHAFSSGAATVVVPASPRGQASGQGGSEVRILDRRSRTSTAVADLDAGDAEYLDAGTELWIRDRAGRIRAVDRDGGVRVVAPASTMVREIGGAVFVITGGVAARVAPGGTVDTAADGLRRALGADTAVKTVLPTAGGDTDVLTTAGAVMVIGRDGIINDRLDVAGVFDPAAIDSAVMVAPHRAWVAHGGTLSLVAADGCGGGRPPCITAERPLPPGLPAGALLRLVDGERFVFDDAAFRWDAGAWHPAGGGAGRALPPPRDVRDGLAAAGRGGRLDAAVLEQDGDDIVIRRPSLPGAAPLRWRGALAAELPPALGTAAGTERWLRWDRGRRLFQMAGRNGGTIAVTPQALFPGGVLAPTLPGRSVASGAAAFVHANASGLWTFPLTHDWADHGPTFTPVSLPPVTAAARGRFYFADGGSIALDGTRIERASPAYTVARDGLAVTEDVRGETVTAVIDVGGRPVDAFAAQGFWHDDRRGIAFDRSGIVVATPGAIVNTRDFHGVALPPGFAAASDAALFNASGALYARAQGRFFRADGGRFSDVRGDPREAAATLASAGGVTLVRDGAGVAVTGEAWRTRSGGGWRFAADQLEGAAHTTAGAIAAATREGIVEARDLDGLASAGPPRRKPPAADGVLERHFRAPQDPVTGFVFKDGGGDNRLGVTLDDGDAPSASEDPLQSRVAVRQGFLTVAFHNRAATVEAEAERPGGGRTTVAVDWHKDEHFPFDHATAIAAAGDSLYLGTASGLIVTRASSPLAGPRLVDTGAGDHVPARVDRVGRPAAAPSRLMARSGSRCLELRGAAVSPCHDAEALDERFLGATPLWTWTARTTPEMVYRDAAGAALGRPVTSFSDGFPHDHPTAAVDCGSFGRVSAWGDGLALITAGAAAGPFVPAHGWGLEGHAAVTDLRGPFRGAAIALYCEPAPDRRTGAAAVAAGVHALSPASGVALLHDGSPDGGQDARGVGWRRESDADAQAVVARWRGALPYDHARLRLVDRGLAAGPVRGNLELQYLTRGRQWRPLKVAGGRYQIDERLDIVTAHGATHVLTPEGLVRLAGDRPGLDPDAVDIVAVPCDVDRIETADGHGATLAAEAGAPTLVRCRDGTVLAGTLDGSSDAGVFTARRAGDPFLERDSAVPGAVSWRIVDRRVGQPGRLEVAWRGERLPLADGRFALDVFGSLARVGDAPVIEMASLQGWIRSPVPAASAGLPLGAVERPRVAPALAAAVRRLAVDVADDGSEVLCLLDDSGRTTVQRLADSDANPPGRRDDRNCGRFEGAEGSHGPWLYRASLQGTAPLAMRARDRGGAPLGRAMSEGRFTDLIATGAPVAAAPPEPALTLIPTPAGIAGIAADGGETPLRTMTGPPPLALLVTGSGDLQTLTADGLAGGDHPCPLQHAVAGLDAMRFTALAMAGDDLLEITGRRNGKPVFYSVSCGEAAVAMPWAMAVPVAGRRRVTANRLPWDRVWLNAVDGQIAAAAVTPAPARPFLAGTQPPLRLLDGGAHAFAVTGDDVLTIDVDALVSALSRDP